MNLEEISFQIISNSGEAKSLAMEAINLSKTNYQLSNEKINQATKYLLIAKKKHMELVSCEAQGNDIKINLLLVHAEDQMLNTETIVLLAKEFISINQKLLNINKEEYYTSDNDEITKLISD